MTIARELAPAKLTLTLRITGVRADGGRRVPHSVNVGLSGREASTHHCKNCIKKTDGAVRRPSVEETAVVGEGESLRPRGNQIVGGSINPVCRT